MGWQRTPSWVTHAPQDSHALGSVGGSVAAKGGLSTIPKPCPENPDFQLLSKSPEAGVPWHPRVHWPRRGTAPLVGPTQLTLRASGLPLGHSDPKPATLWGTELPTLPPREQSEAWGLPALIACHQPQESHETTRVRTGSQCPLRETWPELTEGSCQEVTVRAQATRGGAPKPPLAHQAEPCAPSPGLGQAGALQAVP